MKIKIKKTRKAWKCLNFLVAWRGVENNIQIATPHRRRHHRNPPTAPRELFLYFNFFSLSLPTQNEIHYQDLSRKICSGGGGPPSPPSPSTWPHHIFFCFHFSITEICFCCCCREYRMHSSCCAVACLIRQVLDVTCLRPYAWYKNCLQVNKKKEMHTPSTVWRAKSLSFQLIPRFDKWNRCMRRRRRRRDELADSRQPWDGMAWGCLVMQSSSFPPSPLNAQVTTTISFSTTPLLFFFFGRSEFTRKQKMTLNN